MNDHEDATQDAETARRQHAARQKAADEAFVSLMGRREYRRQWWSEVAPHLFRPRIANEKAMQMMRHASLRDAAHEQWERASKLCPDLLIKTQQEEHERRAS